MTLTLEQLRDKSQEAIEKAAEELEKPCALLEQLSRENVIQRVREIPIPGGWTIMRVYTSPSTPYVIGVIYSDHYCPLRICLREPRKNIGAELAINPYAAHMRYYSELDISYTFDDEQKFYGPEVEALYEDVLRHAPKPWEEE